MTPTDGHPPAPTSHGRAPVPTTPDRRVACPWRPRRILALLCLAYATSPSGCRHLPTHPHHRRRRVQQPRQEAVDLDRLKHLLNIRSMAISFVFFQPVHQVAECEVRPTTSASDMMLRGSSANASKFDMSKGFTKFISGIADSIAPPKSLRCVQ